MDLGHVDGAGILLSAAGVAAILICANGRAVGRRLAVMAHPDADRRRHARSTPQVGGIAILVGLCLWLAGSVWSMAADDRQLSLAVCISTMGVGLIGFADDQTGLSPLARLLSVVIFLCVALISYHGFLAGTLHTISVGAIPIEAWAYVPLVTLAAVGLVNSVNMADGQNGLAGSMLLIWAGCLFLPSSGPIRDMAAVLCVLSGMFLLFNIQGRVFLGDCGSYGVTFAVGLLAILAHARGQVPLETIAVWFFIPVVDCLRLLIGRPLRGMSPFRGDRDHFHHRLEDKMGRYPGLACYILAVLASSVVATVEPRFALVCLCMLAAFYVSFAGLTETKAANTNDAHQEAGNVVYIGGDGSLDHRQEAS